MKWGSGASDEMCDGFIAVVKKGQDLARPGIDDLPLLFARQRMKMLRKQLAKQAIELLVVIAIIAVLIALFAARRAIGARGSSPRPVPQQPQADRPGLVQLPELHWGVPAGHTQVQVYSGNDYSTWVGSMPMP